MKIISGVEMLELAGNTGTIHPVLLWDSEHRVLVDTGYPGQLPLFLDALKNCGFANEPLTEIILTHQDMDHIGCVRDLKETFPNVRVIAHKEEQPYIQGEKTPIKLAALEANFDNLPEDKKTWVQNFKLGFQNRVTAIDQVVTDGEELPFCGGIKIIHTPGHTPGHICLYIHISKTLIAGDALNLRDGFLVGPNEAFTYDMAEAMTSVEKLKQWDVDNIVCYHGGLFQGSVREITG